MPDTGYILKVEPTGFTNRLDMSVRQRQVIDDTKILYPKNCNRPDLSLCKYLLHLAEHQAGGFAVRICSPRKHSLRLSLSPQMPPPGAGASVLSLLTYCAKKSFGCGSTGLIWCHTTQMSNPGELRCTGNCVGLRAKDTPGSDPGSCTSLLCASCFYLTFWE